MLPFTAPSPKGLLATGFQTCPFQAALWAVLAGVTLLVKSAGEDQTNRT